MRRTLVAAVALAPLCLAVGSGVARATDTVTSGVTTPIATATATNGAPDDIDVSTGSVNITTAAPNASGFTAAVTQNSSNNVSVESTVSVSGLNNSVGILSVNAGTQFGGITNSGTISNVISYSPTTNGDGYNDSPFAAPGSAGLYGIRITGPGSLVSDITNTGTITIQGDTSSAISIEAPLSAGFTTNAAGTATIFTGSLINTGTISLTGDDGAAIQSTRAGTIGGQVLIEGAVTATGTNSQAINLAGDIDGRFSVYSTVTSTGYALTTRPTDTTQLQDVQGATNGTVTAVQVQQSAGAVTLSGNVFGGVLIGAPPVGTTTATAATVDLDGDGIPDVGEGVGSIINYGSAPALLIGNSTGAPTTIGAVLTTTTTTTTSGTTTTTTPVSGAPYGVIIEGSVSGEGVYDGVPATGLQIGNSAGQPASTINIAGGVRVVGSVSADSYLANATAIDLKAGAVVPEIRDEDFIESSVSNSVATGTNYAGTTTTTPVSTGVLIEAGAQVSTLTNIGTLQATVNSDLGKAYAVRDLSGSVSNVLNEGVIAASVTPVTVGATPGAASQIALDLSANATGVTLTQMVNPNPLAVDVSTTTSASGQVTTTASITTVTSSTTTTTTTTTAGVTTTTTTTTPTYPQIIGDVLLGNGTNTVNLIGGSVTGALSLGDGAGGSLTIGEDDAGGESTAFYQGALTYGGSGLALNVANGQLINTATGTLNLSSLNVGAKGVLYAAIDPANTASPSTVYNVSGAATLQAGAQLGIVLNSPLVTETTFNIIKAGSLTDLTGGALQQADVPYVLIGTETSNPATGTISIDLRTRTTAELGLKPGEANAFNAIYTNLPNDPAIESALLNTYSKGAFLGVYDQLLPDYSGGVFELALAASDAVTRATSRVNDIENPSGTRGAWAEEVAFGVNHSADANTAGYQGGGFGFVGGLETGGAGLGAFGVTGSFLTGDIKDPHAPGDNLSSFSEGEFGGYWQAQLGGFRGDARVAGGYVLYANRRELLLKDATTGDTTLDRASKASSSGYSATGHVGLGYQTGPIGWVYFRPQVRADYFYLDQGAYTEHGGQAPVAAGSTAAPADGFDLAVAQRNGNEASGVASLVTGMTFGQGFRWRPELEVGYRDVVSGTAGTTTAHFVQGNLQNFSLSADDIKGGGPLGRIDIKADTDFYELNFEAGIEDRTHFTEGDLRISVRVLF